MVDFISAKQSTTKDAAITIRISTDLKTKIENVRKLADKKNMQVNLNAAVVAQLETLCDDALETLK